MNRKISAAVAGTATALVLGLVGCGSSGSSTVSGDRDDVKHVTEMSHLAYRTVPIKTQKCTTKRTSHTSGSGKKRRTYYSNDRSCKSVTTGHRRESYKQVTRDAAYCVELDNVNGSKKNDDVWYTVTSATYYKAARKHEGDRIKKMSYAHSGCWN